MIHHKVVVCHTDEYDREMTIAVNQGWYFVSASIHGTTVRMLFEKVWA